MTTWTAEFPHGVVVEADEDGFSLTGPDGPVQELADRLNGYVTFGWPELPGWEIDTTADFSPEWTYLRFVAAGAIEVTGPCPPCDAEDEAVVPEGTVVG